MTTATATKAKATGAAKSSGRARAARKGAVRDVSVETAPEEAPQVPAVQAEGLEVAWVDPGAVQLDENVRTSARITEEFVESIRTLGVLAPVITHRDLLGQVVVTDGQRRVLAAREAGLTRIPAILAGDPGSPEARVVDQLTLNEARAALTTAERAAAVQQLSLFGMEPATLARKIGIRRDQVDDLLKVAGQAEASRVSREVPDMTIAQAALLADIASSPVAADLGVLDDVEERLGVAPEQADQVLEQARREVAYEEAFRAAEEDLDARGVPHAREGSEADDHYRWDIVYDGANPGLAMYSKKTGEMVLPDAHESCPGHVVLLRENSHSGDIYIEQRTYCTDRRKFGHVFGYERRSKAASKPASEESPEERAAREEAQAKRRHVVEMNRLSDSAQVVRARYVCDLLAQRKPPKETLEFAVLVLGRDYGGWCLEDPEQLLRDAHALPMGVSVRSSAVSAERVLLAAAIATCEKNLPRDFWRHVSELSSLYGSLPRTYLRQLAAWGYGLSDVEREYCEQAEAAEQLAEVSGW